MSISRIAVTAALAIAAAAQTCAAFADSLTFSIRNRHQYAVELEFYSQDRDHVWPGGGQVYILRDEDVHEFSLTCRSGERICYGAWVSNDTDTFWGVGFDNTESCERCCATCGEGDTPTVNLDP
ncbi:MAG: hypothetical protein AB7L41_04685 [Flavobacteriaceae bacterium]